MSPITYFAFGALTLLLVCVDIWQTRGGQVTVKKAAIWSVIWVLVAMAFGVSILFFWEWYAPESHYSSGKAATAFFTGYLLEKSLSVDNLFVFAIIFHQYLVPAELRPRALLWGVIGALVLRAAMIAVGAQLLEQFHWILYVFAAFLIWTGYKLTQPEEEGGLSPLPERVIRKVARVSNEFHGNALVRRNKLGLVLTPMAIVIAVIAMMDVMFALDSIPAIFAVTREPFLVLAANVFALLGLRSLYFVLQGMMDKFVYLKPALAFIMIFIGIKMLLVETAWAIPTYVSLGVLVSVMGTAIVASVMKNRGNWEGNQEESIS
ncbi:TerC [Vibrio nigripulchritudo ATCC 27043]|uniref:TerC/Alx family metal homeostasis membrane protein n=1 Tax=Vibrio nigripulchritudo TaxID=28173 RepID=UPI00021C1C81|nr:TerC/Alx family metal homeostasis membrane protein [Vibrio nigripulchritudo]EGU50930.1 TerC [Vibrio nigripulchritudo ATCC 27043]